MNISKKDVKCPFCGEHYSRDSQNVSESLIYRGSQMNSLRSHVYAECLNPKVHYNFTYTNEPSDSFILFMCKCPTCGKVCSIIIKNGAQYDSADQKVVYVSPTSPRTNLIYKKYVPKDIFNDYDEACKILYLSPQSSATLSRRILEEIIIKHFGISSVDKKGNVRSLEKLINILFSSKNHLDDLTMHALQSLRKTGNAGAHMKVMMNKIVKIKPGEAKSLLQMIEILFNKTYVQNTKVRAIENKVNKDAEKYNE